MHLGAHTDVSDVAALFLSGAVDADVGRTFQDHICASPTNRRRTRRRHTETKGRLGRIAAREDASHGAAQSYFIREPAGAWPGHASHGAEHRNRTTNRAPADPPTNDRDRDVVVVTANKREETVQDIAVAVTAITSELRDEIGLTTVQDYTNFAPGLSYSTANDRLGMRGVTRTSNNFGIRSGISNYVDGVYFSSAIPASREPIFVDRVEVVRGPQGTLYGRDSIGGALNVITKRPTEEFEGQFNMRPATTARLASPARSPVRSPTGCAIASATRARRRTRAILTNYSGLDTEGGRKDDTYIEGQLEFDIGEDLDLWIRAGSLSWDVRYGAPGARTGVDDPYPYNTRFFNSTADLGPNGWFGLQRSRAARRSATQNTNPSISDRYGFNTDFSELRLPRADVGTCGRGRLSRAWFRHQISRRLRLVQLQPAAGSGRHRRSRASPARAQPSVARPADATTPSGFRTTSKTAAGSRTRSTSSRPGKARCSSSAASTSTRKTTTSSSSSRRCATRVVRSCSSTTC